jgi:hypothetical protein
MPTTPKAARLTEDEIGFLQKLLPHFPEYRSESHFLHDATLLGLWVLAVAARRPALPAFGGYDAADLAALIQPRLLAAIDFLAEQGRLPALLRISQALTTGGLPAIPALPSLASGEPEFDPEVAEDMADLGTDFMDD